MKKMSSIFLLIVILTSIYIVWFNLISPYDVDTMLYLRQNLVYNLTILPLNFISICLFLLIKASKLYNINQQKKVG